MRKFFKVYVTILASIAYFIYEVLLFFIKGSSYSYKEWMKENSLME